MMAKCALTLLGVCILSMGYWGKSEGSGTITFETHHRFSENVQRAIGGDGLPVKESLEYYKALVEGDRAVRGRRLAATSNHTTLTFAHGNSTQLISFLHYANVTVGTPPQWFLVALDTGSTLFWLPCNCASTCVRSFQTDDGESVNVNIYDPRKSTSSAKVACNDTMCPTTNVCSSSLSDCLYEVEYLSKNTTTTGVLVEDILHLTTEDSKSQGPLDVLIKLGCSQFQEGLFREAAVNGLMGLGMDEIGVPSMLVKAGVVASDSFSMCFGSNGFGTISFGDKGSSDQLQAPLNLTPFPFYNVTISQIRVGSTMVEEEFTAVFDSGTAVTWLLDPFYSHLTSNFDQSVTDRRIPSRSDNPFEFCYLITSLSDPRSIPSIDFKMKDGDDYHVFDPILVVRTSDGGKAYCLAVIKQDSSAFNIIGQNFMTNYRIVHDRERMILGWRESNCYDKSDATRPMSSPVGPDFAGPPPPRPSSSAGLASPSLLPLFLSLLYL